MADTEFGNGHYLSRSWSMLTQDPGWWKPVLVLALCTLVPIVGPLGVLGYALAWARLTAWGVDAAPKQTKVDVGGCIKAGWTGFVVALGWGVLIGLAAAVLTSLFYVLGDGVGTFMGAVVSACAWVAGLLTLVATLRATVYQKIGPGFGFSQVWTMAQHDFGGLLHVLGIQVLGALVEFAVTLVASVLFFASLVPLIVELVPLAAYGDASIAPYWAANLVGQLFSAWMPGIMLMGYAVSVVSCVFMLLTYTALAIWMRQFDVPAWGGPHDPVPVSGGPVTPEAPVNPAPVAPAAPVSGYQSQSQPAKEALPMDYNAQNGEEPVTPPTNQDMYDDAAAAVTSWTSVVNPTDSTDHLEYKDDPTRRPATASDNGVTPPTPQDMYGDAAASVTAWPEMSLDDSATEAAEEVAGEDLADKDVPQSPVTAPTAQDIYGTASDAVVEWTSDLDPHDDATDHLEYKDDPTRRPATASDNGVTPPTPQDMYGDAAASVTAWPEMSLDDSATAAAEELAEDEDDDVSDGPVPPREVSAKDSGSDPHPVVTPLIKHDDEDADK